MRLFTPLCLCALVMLPGLVRAASPAPDITPAQLAGCYYRGDGLRNNTTLHFIPSGDYTAARDGCLLEPGAARGKWKLSGAVITLEPTLETGSLKEGPRRLHIVRMTSGGFALVPDLDDPRYRRNGPDRLSAFHKLKPPGD